ncbi:hypothetical protein ABZ845_15325 [Streptomyces sp. NPDC047022]|uniref:hypothetical protein n=1 Tax=Streptomyces sp. NPDC047022 TaxID=3155737 RepID=UPI0033E685BA
MSVIAFAPRTEARFALARQVADAVLFEGSALHPYRRSAPTSPRTRLRRQSGVLVPPSWDAGEEEYDFQHTECLMEPKADAVLAVELRFLRARRRTVQRARGQGAFETVAELTVEERTLLPLHEGVEERVEAVVTVDELADGDGVTLPFHRPASEESEPVLDGSGREAGRLIHRYEEISGVLRLSARRLEGPYRLLRLTAVAENTTAWTPGEGQASDRDAALVRSLVATHLLMGLSAGSFLSMAEPPEWAREAVAACRNLHTWPVLAGEPGRAEVMLSSPVILDDHPALGADGPRAAHETAAPLPTADAGPPEWREPTAGTAPGPAVYGPVVVDGRTLTAGSRVRLNPGLRRTDAQDLFLRGRTATVEAVLDDVDGSVHLAVTLDDDPGADIRRAQGTFLYFRPDELTPLEDGA